jgi:hypothetical protein
MENRRSFLKKSALAGVSVSGMGLINTHGNVAEGLNEFYNRKISSKTYRSISFETSGNNEIQDHAMAVFYRILNDRSGIDFTLKTDNSLLVNLSVLPQSMPAEAFRIEITGEDKITVFAADSNGIIYGLGKLLHSSVLSESGFVPGNWQGLSVPEKPFRNIYFATHFHNFYHEAPVEKVTRYIEELAFWGYNTITVWFDMHGFEGINYLAAQAMLDRLSVILKAGKEAGMKTMLTMLANEGYNSSPQELRAVEPRQIKLRGHYRVEICPSKPGGTELILKQFAEEMDEFSKRGLTIDYLSLWPYDQGGCGCSECVPWGSNGYLKITRKLTALAREINPDVKIALSTWLFDCVEVEGEWAGLAEAFKMETPWVDYIMADSHTTYPVYLLSNPVPGNLPLLNFPEISMWGSSPWGGFGANPLPERFQNLWNSVRDKVSGGYPYSEGIFEDINKVIYSQFYWNSRQTALQTLREYVSFEFSSEDAEIIVRAIMILEKNHGLNRAGRSEPGKKFRVPDVDHGAEEAYRMLTKVDARMDARNRNSWRWRILLLRAMLDYEIRVSNGKTNEKIEAGLMELGQLYFADKAESPVRPPYDYKN